jgi:hypothetical protein
MFFGAEKQRHYALKNAQGQPGGEIAAPPVLSSVGNTGGNYVIIFTIIAVWCNRFFTFREGE